MKVKTNLKAGKGGLPEAGDKKGKGADGAGHK
jgi:hypothetical protein